MNVSEVIQLLAPTTTVLPTTMFMSDATTFLPETTSVIGDSTLFFDETSAYFTDSTTILPETTTAAADFRSWLTETIMKVCFKVISFIFVQNKFYIFCQGNFIHFYLASRFIDTRLY